MASAAVIGEPLRIYGYGLAGAVLRPVSDQAAAVKAWRELPADVVVAVLTPSAAQWLSGELAGRPEVLPVVIPDAEASADAIPPGAVQSSRPAEGASQ